MSDDGRDTVETRTFTLSLTKDELNILQYAVGISDSSRWGDPLKDTYEMGDDEPEDKYAAIASASEKLHTLTWEKGSKP